MMQPKGLAGTAIGVGRVSLGERMHREKLKRLEAAARATDEASPWFALRCWTGQELAVLEALEALGIHALVPQRRGPDLRRRGRIMPGRLVPVIHGYVLVQIQPSPEALAALDTIRHAIEVLGGCEHPKRLLPEEVERFNTIARSGTYDWQRVNITFRKGQIVRAKEGLFEGATGEVITARPDGRGDAVVEFDVFGRKVPTNIPLAMLEKA